MGYPLCRRYRLLLEVDVADHLECRKFLDGMFSQEQCIPLQ